MQGYIERERMMLEELAATRALVGRMLDQQQMLVQTIAQLSMMGEPHWKPTIRWLKPLSHGIDYRQSAAARMQRCQGA